MNNFSYADDMVILAPLMKVIRKLNATCELLVYPIKHDIIYDIS